MSKILISFLILALLGSVSAGDCFGQDCAYNADGNPEEEAPISEVVPTVDKEVRRVYWYYLRRANLVYQANIDTQERFLLFFIYRNIVGTFLCIASWNHDDQTSEINTFVRLGNGYDKDIETPYSPVNIQPFIISLRLAHGEYLIEMDENGDFRINGKLINVDDDEEKLPIIDIDAKTKVIDEHVRKTYWYYLGGRDPAYLAHHESIRTSKRVYAVLTYINIVGTFLVIGSCDENDNVWVNTFVRLGAGEYTDKIKEIPPTTLKPAVIDID